MRECSSSCNPGSSKGLHKSRTGNDVSWTAVSSLISFLQGETQQKSTLTAQIISLLHSLLLYIYILHRDHVVGVFAWRKVCSKVDSLFDVKLQQFVSRKKPLSNECCLGTVFYFSASLLTLKQQNLGQLNKNQTQNDVFITCF